MASFYVKYNNLLDKTIKYLGSPKEELREKWIGSLCTFNGILHFIVSIGLYLDKQKYIIKSSGEKKVAVLAVMNNKYRGPMYMALAIHIISGTISHLGSALSIYFENTKYSTFSTNLAIVSSAAELFFHAPTALYLTPFVYGDKGVAPFVYGLVSCLLALSGASALKEALIDKKEGDDNNNNNNNNKQQTIRSEIRRMNVTITIFLYVRIYPILRGVNGILEPQKYALAILVAGTSYLPLGWTRKIFPASFWGMAMYNYKTVLSTLAMLARHGVDGTARRQAKLLRV